jgi:hypothetical protein
MKCSEDIVVSLQKLPLHFVQPFESIFVDDLQSFVVIEFYLSKEALEFDRRLASPIRLDIKSHKPDLDTKKIFEKRLDLIYENIKSSMTQLGQFYVQELGLDVIEEVQEDIVLCCAEELNLEL